MARKGLPRKYAKMGFKKGWAALKKSKRPTTTRSRPRTRRKPVMARRRRYRKTYAKLRGGGGQYKSIIDGFLAGAAGGLATKYVGNVGHPAATLAVGFFRKNNVLKTEGARELGAMLVTQFTGGSNVGGGGGFYE